MTTKDIGTVIQYGVTKIIHAIAHAAAKYAATWCTIFSRDDELKAGAVATNSNPAGARKAKN